MYELRKSLMAAGRALEALGLNRGMSGNISVRSSGGMLISASASEIGHLETNDVVFVDDAGESSGTRPPSSEWRIHRDIYKNRPEVQAVVHTHSVAATTLACLRKDIPPFHYMVVRAGGQNIRCAQYATFGTPELSVAVGAALEDRRACLMANHGIVAVGDSLDEAVRLAGELETLADLYLGALAVGEPQLLTDGEIEEARQQFEALRYGERNL